MAPTTDADHVTLASFQDPALDVESLLFPELLRSRAPEDVPLSRGELESLISHLSRWVRAVQRLTDLPALATPLQLARCSACRETRPGLVPPPPQPAAAHMHHTLFRQDASPAARGASIGGAAAVTHPPGL